MNKVTKDKKVMRDVEIKAIGKGGNVSLYIPCYQLKLYIFHNFLRGREIFP